MVSMVRNEGSPLATKKDRIEAGRTFVRAQQIIHGIAIHPNYGAAALIPSERENGDAWWKSTHSHLQSGYNSVSFF